LATIYEPNARNRRNAFDSGTRIRQWMVGTAERICTKVSRKMCLVLRSVEFECQGQKSKVKVTRDKNALCSQNTPPCGWNGTASLQITSRKQQARRYDHCRGVSLPGYVIRSACGVRWAWRATAGLCHAFLGCLCYAAVF